MSFHIDMGDFDPYEAGKAVVDALHKHVRSNAAPNALNGSSSTYANTAPLPVLESNFWDRPVTPLHFLAIVGGCAAAGFCIGMGAAALLANHWGKKAMDALGLT